jgi:hypothetical protein
MSAWRRAAGIALIGVASCTAPNPAYHPGRDADATDGTARDAAAERSAGDTRPSSADAPAGDPGECSQTADLVLCVRFEGAVVDQSQYRNPISARQVAFAAGQPGGMAVDLGASSLISVADSTLFDLTTITIEAWVNPRASGRRMGIIDYDGQYGMFIQADGTVLCQGSGGGSWLTSPAVTVGTWSSVSCTFDPTREALYIDGAATASSARTGLLRTDSTAGITLGSDGKDGNPFDGLLDNVRIWRVVRSPAQICAAAQSCR